MNIKNKTILGTILFMILLMIGQSVLAVNASFSVSKSSININKGESSTFNITATNCAGQFTASSSNTNVARVTDSLWLDNGSGTMTVKALRAGTTTISIIANDVSDTDANDVKLQPKTITINVTDNSSDSSNTNNSPSNNQSSGATQSNTSTNANASSSTANKSTEARLKNMGITEKAYDFTGFKRDRKEYSIEVPNKVTSLTVYATAVDSKAKVAGTGKVTLKEGDNTVTVTVTAEAGNTETYTLKIKRNTTAEDEAGDSDETQTDNVSGAFGLSSLDIDDVKLNPEFDTEIYQYTIDLTEDLSQLEIETIPTADDTTVEIVGNENLHEGENLITILVKNKKTGQTATYQITVNKNVNSETESDGSEQVEEFNWLKPSTWGKEEIIKVVIIAVLIVLIIIAIILKVKLVKEKKSEKDIDLPGADELDRAISEHQELSELDEFDEDDNFSGFENFDDFQEPANSDEMNDFQSNNNYIEDIAKSQNNKYDFDLDLDYPNPNFDKPFKRKGKGKHF